MISWFDVCLVSLMLLYQLAVELVVFLIHNVIWGPKFESLLPKIKKRNDFIWMYPSLRPLVSPLWLSVQLLLMLHMPSDSGCQFVSPFFFFSFFLWLDSKCICYLCRAVNFFLLVRLRIEALQFAICSPWFGNCFHSILQMRRRVKQAPISFYRTTPTSLFTESETEFIGWTFKCDDTKRKNDNNDENGEMHKECDHNSVKRQRVECS